MTREFEDKVGILPADQAFSISALWTISMTRAATCISAHVNALVQERQSTLKRPAPAQDEPASLRSF